MVKLSTTTVAAALVATLSATSANAASIVIDKFNWRGDVVADGTVASDTFTDADILGGEVSVVSRDSNAGDGETVGAGEAVNVNDPFGLPGQEGVIILQGDQQATPLGEGAFSTVSLAYNDGVFDAQGGFDLTGGGMNDHIYLDVIGIFEVVDFDSFEDLPPGEIGIGIELSTVSFDEFSSFNGTLSGEGRSFFSFEEIADQAESEGLPALDFTEVTSIRFSFDLGTNSTDSFAFGLISEIGASSPTAVPLPAPFLMLGGALAALGLVGGAGRRRRKAMC